MQHRKSLVWSAAALTLATSLTALAQEPPRATTRAAGAPAARPVRSADDAVTPRAGPSGKVRHTQFMNRLALGDVDVLFVGDSITDFWPKVGEHSWIKLAPCRPADIAVSGERTEHVLWRLTNGELDNVKPKLVVVMIGTNNIGQVPADTPEWAAAGVKKVVDTVREKLPDAKVLLLGVFPRDAKADRKRAAVNKMNEILPTFADGTTVRYLDIGRAFLDAEGEIPPDVMPDHLHPSAKGYELWYDAMKSTLDEMLK